MHTTGSTRAPQPQHTNEAQDTVASRAACPSPAARERAGGHSRIACPLAAARKRAANSTRMPRRRARRAAPPRELGVVPRCSARRAAPPAIPACASRGTGPASCAALCAGARRVRRARAGFRRAPGVVRAHAARARRVSGVRRAADLDNLQLAPVCILSQPNRMETGARYEYRSLISRISQPTFAKMARSPNLLGQWRRSPGGDGPQIW